MNNRTFPVSEPHALLVMKSAKSFLKWLFDATLNRSLTYDEFLQTPAAFVDDIIKIIHIKQKWGLRLTSDEKLIKRHINQMHLHQIAKTFNSETQNP